MMVGFGTGGGWFGMGLWWIVIAAVIGIVVWQALRGGPPAPAAETALDMLNKRHARGEIGRADYEQMKRDLAG